jgi:predicted ABC-type exoprotein transport system permease subunit
MIFQSFFMSITKQLLLSFVIFTLFIAVGAFSASSDGAFVRAILGDAYINMTLENICYRMTQWRFTRKWANWICSLGSL